MLAEISVLPVGSGESLGKYIAEVLKVVKDSGIKHELTSMGTVVEIESYTELGTLLEKINARLLEMGVGRVYMVIKIDFRVKGGSIEQKKESVMEKLK